MTARKPAVGPVPDGADPEEYDRVRRRVLWSLPSGLYLVGSRAGDRCNLMTLSWASQRSVDPKLIGVSVEGDALTHELISAGAVFSLCILRREDRAIARKFAKPADHDPVERTLNGMTYHQQVTGAPVMDGCLAFLDCVVRERVPLGDHTLFVGEVVDAGFVGEDASDVLRMEDTRMSYGG